MKIEETYTSFTGLVDTGRFAYFLNTSINGVSKSVRELSVVVENYSCVVIEGSYIFEQVENIQTLIKKTNALNPFIDFLIYTDGCIKPTKITNFNNVKYIINLQYKKTDIPFEKRLNESAINWFIEAESKFVCNVQCKEDVTEALSIIDTFGIPKRLVYITTDDENIEKMINIATKTRLNFAPNYKKLLWNDKGKFK